MEFLKKHWPKLAFVAIFIIIYVCLLQIKNLEFIEFSVKDGRTKNLHYRDGELLEVTAVYKESVFAPEGVDVEVEMIGEVDMLQLGEQPVVYRAEYNGIVNEITVNYVVKDVRRPVITLEGDKDMVLRAGEEYVEPGFTAVDIYDGDVTDQVVVTGEPRANGSFTIKYTVTDSNGNTRVAKRNVTIEVGEDQKVAYLTFDDGPSAYTERLLDVLDQYNIKATFFVTGQNLEYADMIGEAYRRGHTIAVHSYEHDYSIYSSEEKYYEDLEKICDLVVEQTGEEPVIVRFPGGTSNTTSEKYCKGIMTVLAEELKSHGYVYCDWNVSSGDGGGAFDEQTVINNVITGMAGLDSAIILQHDTQPFSVDAVDDIINWGLANGYVFLPLVEDSPMVQQQPLN